MCHAAGQKKSTAILLQYGERDWNALHRDLYGDFVFPLQVVINLSNPGVDHTGGEFLLLEQRPRAQSRGTAFLLPQGHGYVFTTRDRPVESKRGWAAASVRHGVSAVRSGERVTLALVFHDAAYLWTTRPTCSSEQIASHIGAPHREALADTDVAASTASWIAPVRCGR